MQIKLQNPSSSSVSSVANLFVDYFKLEKSPMSNIFPKQLISCAIERKIPKVGNTVSCGLCSKNSH